MFTDMVGFTSAAQRQEAQALVLLREQETLVRPIFSKYGGREIKSTGDGSLIEFGSALKATECAIEIQTRIHERNRGSGTDPIRVRIGIHVGDIESRDSDIFGDAVNLAARILTVSEPEGIALSAEMVPHLQNKLSYPIETLGSRELKGIERRVQVFRVVLPWSGPVQVAESRTYPRLAILPLRNISPDPNDAYFADGMTEELITALGQVRELRVIARSSVDQFKEGDRLFPDIGRELGASAVLEGSVRKSGNRIRISLQLVDVASKEGLWTQTFDRQLDDVFAVQAEVGERTASSLKVRLLGSEKAALSKPPTANLAAYGLYLQGIHLLHLKGLEDKERATELFRNAISEDPSFSAAYSQLANQLLGTIGEAKPARQVVPEARALVEKALALDPLSSEAHTAKGNLAMQGDLNWAIAEAEFRHAIELNPSEAGARLWYGLLLRALQRYADATEQLKTIMELNPLSSGAYSLLASIMRLTGDFEGAERFTRESLRRFLTEEEFHVSLAYTLAYAGRRADALSELDMANSLRKGEQNSEVEMLRARLGEPAVMQSLLGSLEKQASESYVPVVSLAMYSAAAGESEKAFEYLEKDWSEGDRGLWFMYQGVAFDGIRSDPRFILMLERYKLPTSAPFYRAGRAA